MWWNRFVANERQAMKAISEKISEGTESAVRIHRMINSRQERTVMEPIPFKAVPSRCGSEKIGCIGDSDCKNHACEGHPCNTPVERDSLATARFWRGYIAGTILVIVAAFNTEAIASFIFGVFK